MMKRVVRSSIPITAAKIQSKGIFWYIPDESRLLAFPYDPDQFQNSVSRNGLSYTHKKLWPEISGKLKKYSYNYFPRGRVDIDNKGRSVIYMNPNIPTSVICNIKSEFGIRGEVIVKYDSSSHYLCYLDDNWKADK